MKYILSLFLSAVLLVVLSAGHASAQTQTAKIATVDLGKVFTNFYKTKMAQVSLDASKNQILKDENTMLEDLKKGEGDYKLLLAAANDQALSADQRDKKKVAADAKLKDLQDSKAALDEYDRSAKSRLSDQFQRMRDKILTEIRETVSTKAKAAACTLVLDSAAETVNGTPVVIYNNSGAADLTDEVLKALNAGAPIDVTAPAMQSTNRP